MSRGKKDGGSTESAFDIVELITGRIGKIAALVTAAGGLFVLVLTQYENIVGKLTALHWYTPPACVQVNPLIVPATVNYSEWDNMKFKLTGHNRCGAPLGLFVTFVPRHADEARFVVRVPHEDLAECKDRAPREPRCWDPKKPVSTGKGPWEWEVLPPPLAQLSDPRSIEKISITWYVYDYDAPTKDALEVGNAAIEVHKNGTQK